MKGIPMTKTTIELDARIEEAIDKAIQAFWGSIVESFPVSTGGDFDPMYEGVMYHEATGWLRHWLELNCLTCEKCGSLVPESDACYEMAEVSCPGCFSKQFSL